MGMCVSCPAGGEAPAMTAKVIMHDGELREYEGPVKVSHVLGGKDDPAWFVCDADGMEFDGFVSKVGGDDELRPGQIYFVLPEPMLRHPLQAEDLAALAVKANDALVRAAPAAGKVRSRCRTVSPQPCLFAEAPAAVDADVGASKVMAVRRRQRSGGRGRSFASSLTAIPE